MSHIFINVANICDDVIDCPASDDEYFCDLKWIECPEKCICLLYAVSCNDTAGFPWNTPFGSVSLCNVRI